jgi:hypothetical protein
MAKVVYSSNNAGMTIGSAAARRIIGIALLIIVLSTLTLISIYFFSPISTYLVVSKMNIVRFVSI